MVPKKNQETFFIKRKFLDKKKFSLLKFRRTKEELT